jgi:hypothetical protein
MMNMLANRTLYRDAPSATRELETEARIHHEIEAAEQFRAATATYRAAIVLIESEMFFVKGHDKRSILDILDLDFVTADDAAVTEMAVNGFVPGDE